MNVALKLVVALPCMEGGPTSYVCLGSGVESGRTVLVATVASVQDNANGTAQLTRSADATGADHSAMPLSESSTMWAGVEA